MLKRIAWTLGFCRPARCALFAALAVARALGQTQQLSLHDAVEQALQGPQAQAAAGQVEVARGQLRQAGLGLNPRLFLQTEDWRPWDGDYNFTTQSETYAFVSQSFETGGKRHRRVDLATEHVEQARAEEQLVRAEIAGRVAGAYWNAVVFRETVRLLREDMAAVDEMTRYHQERVAAGAMRGVDLLRMQIERDRLRIALCSAERDATQARLELFRQIGRSPQDGVALSEPIDRVPSVTAVPLNTVLTQRADVLLAQEAVAAAEADVRLQQANGIPDLDLIGGYKRNGADNTGYSSLQIPLPFRNRNQGEIDRAKASVTAAKARLAAVQIVVRAEVMESEENYKSEREIVDTLLPDMRERAKENLRLLTEAYRIGGVDLLRFLDAERTEFEVEVSALRTLAEYQQAALRLQLSYGVQP